MIAPSQTEADQLIAAIHTGNLRKAWSPARQAAFFQAQIDAGRKLRDLLVRYPTIDVRKFVFRAHIINLFKSVEYDEAEFTDFLATRKWAKSLSTLARIYESKEFLSLTGLAMDTDGNVAKTLSDVVFKDVAAAIVRGIFEENINTRSLNSVSSPRYTQLMQELRQIITDGGERLAPPADPTTSKTGAESGKRTSPSNGGGPGSAPTPPAGSPDSGQPPSGAPGSTPTKASQKSPVKKKLKNFDLGQIKAPTNYPEALKLLLGELSEIDVQKFPNIAFLVIRAVLEKSIKAYAEAKSIDIKGTGNNQNGRVQLSHALNWLLEHVKASGPRYLIQVVEGVRTGKLVTYTNSGDSLNAINHNHHFSVDPDQALAMWASIDSIMRYVMKP